MGRELQVGAGVADRHRHGRADHRWQIPESGRGEQAGMRPYSPDGRGENDAGSRRVRCARTRRRGREPVETGLGRFADALNWRWP